MTESLFQTVPGMRRGRTATMGVLGAGVVCVLSCATVEPQGSGDGGSEDLAASAPGDSLPTGTVSFFARQGCPMGWEPFALGVGRTVVPSIGRDPVGVTQGTELSPEEDRLHSHTAQGNVLFPAVSYAGIAGEANHGLGRAGTYAVTVTVKPASAGLPYVQLLVCKKLAPAHPVKPPPPAGTLIFFSSSVCPQGYSQPALTQGRYLVGKPDRAPAGLSFGGPSLAMVEKRTHGHAGQLPITTTSHGIALLSNGGATDYVKDGTHAAGVTAAASAVDFPYVQLLQCQKD